MDSDSFLPLSDSLHLPVIDFSDQTLTPGTSKWDKVKADVRKALEDFGCFEAFFGKVSNIELDKSVLKAMEELFDLPVQTKQRNVSSKPFHGYLSHDLYQSLGIDDANVAEKVNDFTQQLWPGHGNNIISETMHEFSKQLVELDVMVRRMIMESFGIEKYIDEHLNSTNYLIRMMKYTAPPDDDVQEAKLGLGSHTDKNIITILHQYQVDGLEIKTKDEKWIKVKPSQHSFIVMVGDSLCALLNGRLSSPYHRVVMAKKTRYSTALFSVPKSVAIIDSPEELVDEEHPRMFKPFKYNDFLHFFHTEAGRRVESVLHAFCAL
uniref:Alkenyl hydroxalkyl producing 1 n=1 Tax=Isatis tinctoria TaxID=161756 RepID=A0A8E9ZQW0_ISATI|nr:alkenyl hydroxalkyl producing 1 [Isatis tinctoria]